MTAVVAAAMAAPSAIRAICQPVMPPASTARMGADGAGGVEVIPPKPPGSGMGIVVAEAAGTLLTTASRLQPVASVAGIIRRQRGERLRAACGGSWGRRGCACMRSPAVLGGAALAVFTRRMTGLGRCGQRPNYPFVLAE